MSSHTSFSCQTGLVKPVSVSAYKVCVLSSSVLLHLVTFSFQITSLLCFDRFLDVISQLVVLASKEGVAGSESIQEKALEMLRVKLEKTKISKPHVSLIGLFTSICLAPIQSRPGG